MQDIFDVKKYHEQGVRGQGIKIAILDSGIGSVYSQIHGSDADQALNIVKIVDFTKGSSTDESIKTEEEEDGIDNLGHGTFVTGLISSKNEDCPGMAPDAEIYILKLFTDNEITYSSWFIDAFNFVLDHEIDIVNLSLATKDTRDTPFIEKIAELTAAGIIVVSAIGNDGPTQGSSENPGDLIEVIGVGSLSADFDAPAAFTSRGMTKSTQGLGIGIPKPDLLLPGENILSLDLYSGQCIVNQGTSFSVPILSGSIALALSSLEKEHGYKQRRKLQNSALIKQAIFKSAINLKDQSIVEQGSGKFNLDRFYEQILKADHEDYPKVQVYPYALNLTANSDYYLPFSRQRMYSSMQPFLFDFSVMTRTSAHFSISNKPEYEIVSPLKPQIEQCLSLEFEYEPIYWPFFGVIKTILHAVDTPKCRDTEAKGTEIRIKFPVELHDDFSKDGKYVMSGFKIIIDFIKTPPRHKRLLFDQFHQMNYPENGFIWKDSVDENLEEEQFEWLGDHVFTNFEGLYSRLIRKGFFIEILNEPLTCFIASNYKALLLVDIEDYLSETEMKKVRRDVEVEGLSLIVVADWYNEKKLHSQSFANIVTFENWLPFMGGSNIPTLNALLEPYQIQFGQSVHSGQFMVDEQTQVDIVDGSEIIAFPAGAHLMSPSLTTKIDSTFKSKSIAERAIKKKTKNVPSIGIFEELPGSSYQNSGAIIVMTDSDCLSNQLQIRPCYRLFEQLVQIATRDKIDQRDSGANNRFSLLSDEFILPSDLHKAHETPKVESLDQFFVRIGAEGLPQMINSSFVNSFSAYNFETGQHLCPYKTNLSKTEQDELQRHANVEYDESNYLPYQHLDSEKAIQMWTKAPRSSPQTRSWFDPQFFRSPITALRSGKVTGPTLMLISFIGSFCLGIYCLRRFKGRSPQARICHEVRARQARREAMHLSYESSDGGYSGSEMDFDMRSEGGNSSYSTGESSISFDNEIDIPLPADYH